MSGLFATLARLRDERNRYRFCTQCGVVERIDEDGTCASCGCDTCDVVDAVNNLLTWAQREAN